MIASFIGVTYEKANWNFDICDFVNLAYPTE